MVRYELTSKSLSPLKGHDEPRYSNRTAWRATVPYTAVHTDFREDVIRLWLGHNAHLVHYPVKGGTAINIVAITDERRTYRNWASNEGTPAEALAHFPREAWSKAALDLLAVPEIWLRWPLFDRPPSKHWGRGPVTLLGDAAHPMLPFLAQGAAMAIEDAAVLANCLQITPDEPQQALRLYEDERRARTARVQRTARRNGRIYHLGGLAAFARDHVLRKIDSERLLTRFDWLYDWRPSPDPE
jgi:salicylate hydroxylase